MPENNPIPDAELEEVKRLVAQLEIERHPITLDDKSDGWIRPDGDAELGSWRVAKFAWSDDANAALKLVNAFTGILARLEAAEKDRDNLEAELEQARDDSAEYEKDCKKALCSLARELDYEWDGDGATADDLREFISGVLSACGALDALAARDAQQRREGAAEWFDNHRDYNLSAMEQMEKFTQAAKRLREGGE